MDTVHSAPRPSCPLPLPLESLTDVSFKSKLPKLTLLSLLPLDDNELGEGDRLLSLKCQLSSSLAARLDTVSDTNDNDDNDDAIVAATATLSVS